MGSGRGLGLGRRLDFRGGSGVSKGVGVLKGLGISGRIERSQWGWGFRGVSEHRPGHLDI